MKKHTTLTGQVVTRARDGVALEGGEIYTVIEEGGKYVLLIPVAGVLLVDCSQPLPKAEKGSSIIRTPTDKFLDQMLRGFWKRVSTAAICDDK